LENRVCLSSGVQVAGAAWRVATRIVAGVGDLVHWTGDGRTGRVLSGWAVERSGGTVCGQHRTCGGEEHAFLGWALKPRSTVWPQNHLYGFRWFGLKTSGDGFLRFDLKTGGDSFSRFGLKTGCCFLG
jgi:hypothetical protein